LSQEIEDKFAGQYFLRRHLFYLCISIFPICKDAKYFLNLTFLENRNHSFGKEFREKVGETSATNVQSVTARKVNDYGLKTEICIKSSALNICTKNL
jgi:hypothetical protein